MEIYWRVGRHYFHICPNIFAMIGWAHHSSECTNINTHTHTQTHAKGVPRSWVKACGQKLWACCLASIKASRDRQWACECDQGHVQRWVLKCLQKGTAPPKPVHTSRFQHFLIKEHQLFRRWSSLLSKEVGQRQIAWGESWKPDNGINSVEEYQLMILSHNWLCLSTEHMLGAWASCSQDDIFIAMSRVNKVIHNFTLVLQKANQSRKKWNFLLTIWWPTKATNCIEVGSDLKQELLQGKANTFPESSSLYSRVWSH